MFICLYKHKVNIFYGTDGYVLFSSPQMSLKIRDSRTISQGPHEASRQSDNQTITTGNTYLIEKALFMIEIK